MSLNLVTLLYLIASVCFIQALKGLSHPTTARLGNVFGMVGMALAAFTTVALIYKLADGKVAGLCYVVGALLVHGYRFETIESLHTRPRERPSDFDFNKFTYYLLRGLWPFLVLLICQLVMMPLMFVVWGGSVMVMAAADEAEAWRKLRRFMLSAPRPQPA